MGIAYGSDPIRVDAELLPGIGGYSTAEADLGWLPAGEKVDVEVRVVNRLSRAVQFDRLKLNGSLNQAEATGDSLPAGGELTIHADLTIPNFSHEVDQSIAIYLAPAGKGTARETVRLRFQVSELLRFHTKTAQFSCDSSDNQCVERIPVTITKPIDAAKVSVTGTGDFRNARGAIVHWQDRDWLQFEVDREDPNRSELAGTLTIEDPVSNRKDMITCLVRYRVPVTVRPGLLFARPAPDEKSYAVTAFVRLYPTEESAARFAETKTATQAPVVVAAHLGEHPMDVTTHPLGAAGVYRVEAVVPERFVEEAESIQWQVKTDGKVYYVNTRVGFPR
ncbi:hypothetical protein [Rosistilla ulvae]|uniref:hypothetical protein n=1 Tax=Rosistilla ulvae TaxID=1930277 RepID=UPI0011A6E543|nr:hypothetical protein [Rosistilla ulvae]